MDSAGQKQVPANIEALLSRLELYRMISDAIPSCVSYLDSNLIYRYVNAHYEVWFKKKSHEIVGKSVLDLLGEDTYKNRLPYLQRALGGEMVAFQAPCAVNDGSIWTDLRYIPDIDSNGKVQGLVVSVVDVTKVHGETERAERLAKSREELIAFASHELKTPLTSLKLHQELVSRKIERQGFKSLTRDEIITMLEISRRQTDRLVQLIDNMLKVGTDSSKN